jgi:prophage regulatory protein
MQTTIPQTGYLRIKQILGDRTANPPIPAIIPIGKSSWWLGVKTGRYPQPVKLGPRTTVWRASDIQQLVDNPEPQKK